MCETDAYCHETNKSGFGLEQLLLIELMNQLNHEENLFLCPNSEAHRLEQSIIDLILKHIIKQIKEANHTNDFTTLNEATSQFDFLTIIIYSTHGMISAAFHFSAINELSKQQQK